MIAYKKLYGSCNTTNFLEFLKSLELNENTVVLMDNVAFHHSKVVKEYIVSKKACCLYTPPYSPWFNWIENCFSIVKRRFYENESIDDSFLSLTDKHIQQFYKSAIQKIEM